LNGERHPGNPVGLETVAKYLDLTQRRALIAKAPADLAVFLGALSLVPLRPGAMAGLVAGNFDKRLSTLTIGKDKHGQDRKITLPPATATFFAEQGKNKLPTAPLLARADGSAWNKDSWKYPFKDAVIAAELPATATAYGGETGPTSVECAIEEQDGALVITTAAWFNRDDTPFSNELIARTATGSCAFGPVDPGEWTARYADRDRTLTVPGGEVCFQAANFIPL
jgi:hypothetical protein